MPARTGRLGAASGGSRVPRDTCFVAAILVSGSDENRTSSPRECTRTNIAPDNAGAHSAKQLNNCRKLPHGKAVSSEDSHPLMPAPWGGLLDRLPRSCRKVPPRACAMLAFFAGSEVSFSGGLIQPREGSRKGARSWQRASPRLRRGLRGCMRFGLPGARQTPRRAMA